jgi:hypothetical protein
MQPILIVRLSVVGAFAAALFLGACSSAPADEATQDVTSESALSSCGHRVGNGPLIGEGPNACVPGTKDFTTAACAHPNSRRVRTCDSNCRFGSFGMCECTPTSCAGRICGDDGCGGSCGACPGYQTCNEQGTQCLGSITGSGSSGGGGGAVGSCLGKSCGPDGAGGSCGLCPGGTTCNAGACVVPLCVANADGCFKDSMCCSGSCYVGLNPAVPATCVACKPSTIAGFCSKDSQCCSGLCDTREGACVDVCKSNKSRCTNNAQCCSNQCNAFGHCAP